MLLIEHFRKTSFKNHKNDRKYILVPAHQIVPSENVYECIQSICNEPLIYDNLFRTILNNTLYTREKAENFISWCREGWDRKSHFVFLMIDEDEEKVTGAVDIKSNDLNSGEIGYWVSQHHSGIATPAVEQLAIMAKKAGFINLHAYVAISNHRSASVLSRNGFIKENKTVTHNNKDCHLYRKKL